MKKVSNILILFIILISCEKLEDNKTVLVSDYIYQDENWTSDNIYCINGDVHIESKLTIEPGTIIKFNKDATLDLTSGKLIAEGTEEQPITFTSNTSSPKPGDWGYVVLWRDSKLSFCNFKYGGGGSSSIMMIVEGENNEIKNCSFEYSKGAGVSFGDFAKIDSFKYNTIQYCESHPLAIRSNQVSFLSQTNIIKAKDNFGIVVYWNSPFQGIHIWKTWSMPYYMGGGFEFEDSDNSPTLILEPGCVLKFLPLSFLCVGMWDRGKLVAEGTIDKPIVFTSASENPQPGDWWGIWLGSYLENGTVLKYCKIEYVGKNTNLGSADYPYGSINIVRCLDFATVDNCTIRNTPCHGISVQDASPKLSNNSFYNIGGENVYVFSY